LEKCRALPATTRPRRYSGPRPDAPFHLTAGRAVSEPPSPCIGAANGGCRAVDDVCRGCFRSLDEIMAWRDAGEAARRAILEAAARRRLSLMDEP